MGCFSRIDDHIRMIGGQHVDSVESGDIARAMCNWEGRDMISMAYADGGKAIATALAEFGVPMRTRVGRVPV